MCALGSVSLSPFSHIASAPPDPILGIKQAFLADPRREKADLSVGVYQDDQGQTTNLGVVEEAFRRLLGKDKQAGYLPIDGLPAFNSAVKQLVFGKDSALLLDERVATVQSLGGTGALRFGADFLKRHFPGATVYMSSPTWANHPAIFQAAGMQAETYPYLNKKSHTVDFSAMCESLSSIKPGSIVLLHASCHNPTGIDPTLEQWDGIIEVLKKSNALAFIDFAYQGLAQGLEQDAAVVRKFAAAGLPCLVAHSCSKNLSMYRRRVGSLSVVTADKDEAGRVLSQLKVDIRTNNSNPPYEGAAAVSLVLSEADLRIRWEAELAGMRERIKRMRSTLVELLEQKGLGGEFHHLLSQNGMFSYSGLSKEHVLRLKEQFGIYLVDSGRMCVAALTPANIEHVADAIARVFKGDA